MICNILTCSTYVNKETDLSEDQKRVPAGQGGKKKQLIYIYTRVFSLQANDIISDPHFQAVVTCVVLSGRTFHFLVKSWLLRENNGKVFFSLSQNGQA